MTVQCGKTQSPSRTCQTCAKLSHYGKCRVLTKRIGNTGECWAWTDDPRWQVKAKNAVRNYAWYKEGRHVECVS